MMAVPGVIVLERRPRWTPELQRQFADEEVRVRSCRRVADMGPMFDGAPQCVLVLDLDAGAADCLQFLGRRIGRVSSSPIIAIGPGRLAGLEWPVRELGVLAFLPGSISGEELADLCRRQWGPTDARSRATLERET